MIYDISDIHGSYDAYRRTLREFSLKPTDTIYVLATGWSAPVDGSRS